MKKKHITLLLKIAFCGIMTIGYIKLDDSMFDVIYYVCLGFLSLNILDFILGDIFKMEKDTTPIVERAYNSKTGKVIGGYVLSKEALKEAKEIWKDE